MVVIVGGHVHDDDDVDDDDYEFDYDDDDDDIVVCSQLPDVSSCCSYVTLTILGKLIFFRS